MNTKKKRNYSDAEFTRIVKESFSIRSCLSALGLKLCGGNYKCFYSKVSELGLDIKHFTGRGHLKGKNHSWTPKQPLTDILKENNYFNTNSLKLRLFKENVKERKCEVCFNTEWLGKPIPLELDHINGINTDNRLQNLKILCPNCHAQTDTYRGRNKNKQTLSSK